MSVTALRSRDHGVLTIVGVVPAQYGPQAIDVYWPSNYAADKDHADRTAGPDLVQVDVIAWAIDDIGRVLPVACFRDDVPGFNLRGDAVRTVTDDWWPAS